MTEKKTMEHHKACIVDREREREREREGGRGREREKA